MMSGTNLMNKPKKIETLEQLKTLAEVDRETGNGGGSVLFGSEAGQNKQND